MTRVSRNAPRPVARPGPLFVVSATAVGCLQHSLPPPGLCHCPAQQLAGHSEGGQGGSDGSCSRGRAEGSVRTRNYTKFKIQCPCEVLEGPATSSQLQVYGHRETQRPEETAWAFTGKGPTPSLETAVPDTSGTSVGWTSGWTHLDPAPQLL